MKVSIDASDLQVDNFSLKENRGPNTGLYLIPSSEIPGRPQDITGYIITASDQYGKLEWSTLSIDKLSDVDLVGANDGDILKYNKQENLWLPSPMNNISGGDSILVDGDFINLLYNKDYFDITPQNELTLLNDSMLFLGSDGINISLNEIKLGETLDISVDNTVIRTTGNQIKVGDLEIDGLMNANVLSDGVITINSGDISNVVSLSFMESNGGTDEITLMAPNSIDSGGYILNLPPNQGSANYLLANDGLGNLFWKQGIDATIAGGNEGNIQFNKSNGFEGTDNFTFDGVNVTLTNGQMFATAFNANSDINLKKDIKPTSNCIEIINKIETYEYKWKSTSEKSFGVIAQQLEEIGLESIVKTNNGIKSVNYNELLSILIGAVKELSEKISKQ